MTETEIIETLKRSGYFFESSIIEFLNSKDYFIESNSVIIDRITKKNRDIDITAHKNDINKDYENKISSLATFVFELKNNLYPVVLSSRYQFNPNSPDDLLKEYISEGVQDKGYDGFQFFYEQLIYNSGNIYTQYCSFQKKNKNAELMALHPEQLYSGISKVVQYCEESVPWWYEKQESIGEDFGYYDEWYRHWIFLPIILLKNDLYELDINNNIPKLNKTERSQLIFNYHHKDEPKSILVTFVTEKGLVNLLDEISNLEIKSEKELLEKKKTLHNKV